MIATEQNRVHVLDPVQKILATTNRLQKWLILQLPTLISVFRVLENIT